MALGFELVLDNGVRTKSDSDITPGSVESTVAAARVANSYSCTSFLTKTALNFFRFLGAVTSKKEKDE